MVNHLKGSVLCFKVFCTDIDIEFLLTRDGLRAEKQDGYFNKRGAHALIWNTRYFILDKGILEYYKQGSPGYFRGTDCVRTLHLADYSNVSKVGDELSITLTSNNKSVKEYVFAFERLHERDKFFENMKAHLVLAAELMQSPTTNTMQRV